MTEPAVPLPAEAAAAWKDWCTAETIRRARDRRDAAEAHFMSVAKTLAPRERTAFAEWWCGRRSGEIDGPDPVPFRMSLLSILVAPVLSEGRRAGRPGYARWTACLRGELEKAAELGYPVESVPELDDLMREALAVDPSDDRTRRLWLRGQIARIDYSLHELPAVLAPADDLMLDAERARALAGELGEADRLAEWFAAVHDVLEDPSDPAAIRRYRSAPNRWYSR